MHVRAGWTVHVPARTAVPALVLGLLAGVLGGVLAVPGAADAATVTVPVSFSLSGAGWGHGVGMSQVGAYGQAAEGRTATQILTH
jgi:hypothetical protein